MGRNHAVHLVAPFSRGKQSANKDGDFIMKIKTSWHLHGAVAFALCASSPAMSRVNTIPGMEFAIDASKLKSIEATLGQGTNVSAAGVEAGVRAAAAAPGYSAGAGVAGSLLGALIVSSMADSSARKIANKPIAALRGDYAAHWKELNFETTLQDVWNQHAPKQQRCASDAKTKCESRLKLSPELLMLASGRVFSVSIEANLQDWKGRTLYKTRLNYLSDPVPATSADVNEFWSHDSFHALTREWTAALDTLVPMLSAQIERREKTSPGAGEPIRYANAAGIFYDRGVILSQDGHRLIYRTLDGGINVVSIERMLNSDEYYQWLTAPHAPSPAAASAPAQEPTGSE